MKMQFSGTIGVHEPYECIHQVEAPTITGMPGGLVLVQGIVKRTVYDPEPQGWLARMLSPKVRKRIVRRPFCALVPADNLMGVYWHGKAQVKTGRVVELTAREEAP